MDSVLYLLAYLFNDKKLINEKTISIRVSVSITRGLTH